MTGLPEPIETVINGRWTLQLPPHRAERPEWATGWERERLDSMHQTITAGRHYPVLYDIGTEEGDLSALYATWGASVVLIEPNPKVWPNVAYIWQANDLRPPLATFAGFAGPENRDGHADWPDPELRLGGFPTTAGGPLIGDHGFLNLSERPDCPSLRVDRIADLVGAPDYLTMDVEGAELLVLRGAAGVLDHHRPVVWVSVHPQFSREMYDLTREDVLLFMAGHGYQSELLAVDHEEHWVFRPIPSWRP